MVESMTIFMYSVRNTTVGRGIPPLMCLTLLRSCGSMLCPMLESVLASTFGCPPALVS